MAGSIFDFNLFSKNANDLRNYDVVVHLDLGSDTKSNDKFLYVAENKAGEISGEIIKLDPKEFEKAQSMDSINFIGIGQMSDASIKKFQTDAAVKGANSIAKNNDVYSKGGYTKLGFDLDRTETATKEMLPQIEQALTYIVQDKSVGVDRAHYEVAEHDDKERQASYEKQLKDIKSVSQVLDDVKIAGDLPEYKSDLLDEIKNSSDLNFDQQNVLVELLTGDNSTSKTEPTTEKGAKP